MSLDVPGIATHRQLCLSLIKTALLCDATSRVETVQQQLSLYVACFVFVRVVRLFSDIVAVAAAHCASVQVPVCNTTGKSNMFGGSPRTKEGT
jgi:hypothetical protein